MVVRTPFFLSLLQLAILPECIRNCDADANLSPLSIMSYYRDSLTVVNLYILAFKITFHLIGASNLLTVLHNGMLTVLEYAK